MTPKRREIDTYNPQTPFEATVLEKLSTLEHKANEINSALFGMDGIEKRVRKVENKQYWLSGVAAAISAAATWFTAKH